MKVSISGYQVIKDVVLEIEGITLIVGSNSHGKSAAMRAIEAAIFSDVGDDFINDDSSYCQVNLKYTNDPGFEDFDITWTKSKGSGAIYTINKERYAKERGKPPLDVLSTYGFRETKVRDTKQRLFFWRLHDGLFMVTENPSYVFGYISNLMQEERIVPVIKGMAKEGDEVRKKIMELETRETLIKTTISELQVREKQIDKIVAYSDHVEKLRGMGVFLERLGSEYNSLESVSLSIEHYRAVVNSDRYRYLPQITNLLSVVGKNGGVYVELCGIYEKLHQTEHNIAELENRKQKVEVDFGDVGVQIRLHERLEGVLNGLESSNRLLHHLKEIQADSCFFPISEKYFLLKSQFNLFREMSDSYSIISIPVNSVEKLREQVSEISDNLELAHKELDTFKKEVGVCPLCGSKFDT